MVRCNPLVTTIMSTAIALVSPLSSATAQTTLRVGPGETYTSIVAAASAAADGDRIEIRAGTYREEVVWRRNDLTIVGEGRVILDRTNMALTNEGGKGIFIVNGANTTIENIEFVGAEVASAAGANGAGIRWQGAGSLVVASTPDSSAGALLDGGTALGVDGAFMDGSSAHDSSARDSDDVRMSSDSGLGTPLERRSDSAGCTTRRTSGRTGAIWLLVGLALFARRRRRI